MPEADIGIIGLAVMGESLALNMESHGYTVAVFNRTISKVDAFTAGRAKGKRIIGAHSVQELCACLKRPRKVLLMVKAGQAVDVYIDRILPFLEDGDIIIDGGNSHYSDSTRRTRYVESEGRLFVGTGVSGGEEGALKGPSIMPGGSSAAWEHVQPVFQAIAAKTKDGTPCCEWVGPEGAGHFVKMVHNGIEYGDMQLICEVYHLMRDGLGLSLDEMRDVFDEWNRGQLDSYLIEITRDILGYRDEAGEAVINCILDTAGQKGTGKWTAIAALDVGQPLTLIGEAVFARCLSALKDERLAASETLRGPSPAFEGDKQIMIEDLRQALYASKIVSYAQGYALMRAIAQEHVWNLNYGGLALLWRGGCIIRSVFLARIKEAFDRDPELVNLLLDPFFAKVVTDAQPAWRRVVATAVSLGIPVPAMSAALAYFDGYRSPRLSANLLQAQRDYFGAHMYERIDKPRGELFHTNWTGRGGRTASSSYVV
ncbi:MAG: decarboxylating NADP(+)-dependent phosphogluconate dehydrogenase [Phycisphaerales bacterium]|nr:MAG: decarboxylating NADP(+)-dependent phosphogluconate dehydrogenase [Phycisphaerales bacterium]